LTRGKTQGRTTSGKETGNEKEGDKVGPPFFCQFSRWGPLGKGGDLDAMKCTLRKNLSKKGGGKKEEYKRGSERLRRSIRRPAKIGYDWSREKGRRLMDGGLKPQWLRGGG